MEKFDLKNIILKPEQPSDYHETENVTREAFWNHHVPGCDEHYLLHTMRAHPTFIPALNIIAVYNNKIIGHIAYAKSIIKTDTGKYYEVLGLGPISVLPEYQGKGVGGRLIEYTKQLARQMEYSAIFLYGDPEYYSQHGFIAAENFDIRTADNMYAEALQLCALHEHALSGITGCYFEGEIYEVDEAAAAEFDKGFPPKDKIKGTASQNRFSKLVRSRKARGRV